MNRKMMFLIGVILILILVCCVSVIVWNGRNNESSYNHEKRGDHSMKEDFVSNIKVRIKGKDYSLVLEENETTAALMNLLPLEMNMNELNGNEKYFYLDESLPTNSKNPGKIQKGDVMLYGDNCIVIFYESFETSYRYTRIGHIDGLPDLGNGSIEVKLTK